MHEVGATAVVTPNSVKNITWNEYELKDLSAGRLLSKLKAVVNANEWLIAPCQNKH